MRPMLAAAYAPVSAPDPAELTAAEQDAITLAETLDSGSLAERLADTAHDISRRSTTGPDELRDLAALALVLARRTTATAAHPDTD